MQAVDEVIAAIRDDVSRQNQRFVVALAGAPAAGKSTLACRLADRLSDSAIVLGLDAFHFDDSILEARGDRLRKGAPHTFDVDGYRSMVDRLKTERTSPIALPVFDRSLELTRRAALIAEPNHRIVITEGNWLLLDDPPWQQLRPLFDLTVWVDAPVDILRARIIERWKGHGFSDAEAQRRADENDVPNAELAMKRSARADLAVDTS